MNPSMPDDRPPVSSSPDDHADRDRHWIIALLGVLAAAAVAAVILLIVVVAGDDDGDQVTTEGTPTPVATAEPTSAPTGEPTAGPTPTAEPTAPEVTVTPTALATPTPTPTSTASPSATPTATASPDEPAGAGSPGRAARGFVEAVSDSDTEAAWALLGPRSRADLGDIEGLEDLMGELAEGWGAWAADGVDVDVVELGVFGDGPVSVATFRGEIAQEGTPQSAAAAMPVVTIDGMSFAEPLSRGDLVRFRHPEITTPPAVIDGAGSIRLAVPSSAEDVWIVLDGEREVEHGAPNEDGDLDRYVVEIQPALAPGEHVLVVAYRSPEALHADAVLFEVAN